MRRLLLLAYAVSTLALPTMAAERGRIIGDGSNLPREYVVGKDHNTRRSEIAQWIMERGGRYSRTCNAKDKVCGSFWVVNLTGGGSLAVALFNYPANSSRNYSTYCRETASADTLYCYGFENMSYFTKIKDTATREWTEIWDERNDSRTTPAAKSSSDSLL